MWGRLFGPETLAFEEGILLAVTDGSWISELGHHGAGTQSTFWVGRRSGGHWFWHRGMERGLQTGWPASDRKTETEISCHSRKKLSCWAEEAHHAWEQKARSIPQERRKRASPFFHQSSSLSEALLAETDREPATRAEMCFLGFQLKNHQAECIWWAWSCQAIMEYDKQKPLRIFCTSDSHEI